MTTLDDTRRALEEGLVTFAQQVYRAGAREVPKNMPPVMALADAYALAAVDEYDARDECNWSKYEALDGTRCVHHAEGRELRHQGKPLAECRLALRESLEKGKEWRRGMA